MDIFIIIVETSGVDWGRYYLKKETDISLP